VRKDQNIITQALVTAIFWEAFSAGSAVAALLGIGFADSDIDAIGVLTGRPPDLSDFLTSIGVPRSDASYYNDCFQDGAVLLLIRTQPWAQQIAVEIVRKHGGLLAPNSEIQLGAASEI
jgi:hypothetical protein